MVEPAFEPALEEAAEETAEEVVAGPPKKRAFERNQKEVVEVVEQECVEEGPCLHPEEGCSHEMERVQTPKVEVLEQDLEQAARLSCWFGEKEDVAWRVSSRPELGWSWLWS